MKIFVTGASGQLGSEICKLSKHENYGTYLSNYEGIDGTNLINLDITDRTKTLKNIEKIRPDWIVHCAAMSKVDLCEEQKGMAWSANVNGTENIINAAKSVRSGIVFVSSDYVFDGKKGLYKETDTPNPLNFYAKTKLAGEWLAEQLDKHIIVRSSVLYSNNKKNFVSWVLESLRNGEVRAVTDQINSPTLSADLADSILRLIEKGAVGLYHAAGEDRISRYDFAIKIAEAFNFDKKLIVPVKTAELNQKALRPQDSSLDTSKIKRLGIKLSNVNDGLEKLKEQMEMKLE